MTTDLNLAPLFGRSVGFDRFNNLFESTLRGNEQVSQFPPYNIEKLNEDKYRITMAIAGFSINDINITAKGNELSISGNVHEENKEDVEVLHKGIADRNFERKFSLADYVEVKGARLNNGLLVVDLERELPESAKPRMIQIETDDNAIESKAKKGDKAH